MLLLLLLLLKLLFEWVGRKEKSCWSFVWLRGGENVLLVVEFHRRVVCCC